MQIQTHSPEETEAVGRKLAAHCSRAMSSPTTVTLARARPRSRADWPRVLV